MSEHTPGPWEIGREAVQDSGATWIWVGPQKWDTRVARVVLYEGEENAQRANAHLISAAPDLLEALKRLDAHGHTQATWGLALKAIAKAEGRS